MNKPQAPDEVYLLEHFRIKPICDGEISEDLKLIGVFASRALAESAVEALRRKPGFRDFPELIDPEVSDEKSGFFISRKKLNAIGWEDGFISQEEAMGVWSNNSNHAAFPAFSLTSREWKVSKPPSRDRHRMRPFALPWFGCGSMIR